MKRRGIGDKKRRVKERELILKIGNLKYLQRRKTVVKIGVYANAERMENGRQTEEFAEFLQKNGYDSQIVSAPICGENCKEIF